MRLSQGHATAIASHDQPKMEDRKRSLAVDQDDATPPSKRQATTANGSAMRMEPEKEKEVEVGRKTCPLSHDCSHGLCLT